MNKLFLSLFILFSSLLSLAAQPTRRSIRDVKQKEVIDTAKYAISYRYMFYENEEKKNPYFDHCILEIGHRGTRYYSEYSNQMDSLMFSATKPIDPISTLHRKYGLNSNERGYPYDCYTNYQEDGHLITSANIQGSEYVCNELIPKMEWEIIQDSDSTIMGYACVKAALKFRGRDYTAWFTTQIPISVGPWKFGGLPGLIMKIEEQEHFFAWEAFKIVTPKARPIYSYLAVKKQRNITRTQLLGLFRILWEDPIALAISLGRNTYIEKNGKSVLGKPGEKTYPKVPAIELE